MHSKLSERYEKSPHKWNLTIMLSIGAILWSGLLMTVQIHSTSQEAHPAIVMSLNDIQANQIKAQIFAMDARICKDPANRYYKQELIRLINLWESLKDKSFPRELLECT